MMLKSNLLVSIFLSIVGILFTVSPALAHVIVYPHQVGVAAVQDFTVSVPNERNNPVVSVKLLIPKDLTQVTPNATPGWDITIKSKGKDENAAVSEIDWNNGSIPVGEREEFILQAQVPPNAATLVWKAYQTYSDGTVVSWDVDPSKIANLSDTQQDQLAKKENRGEYSTTQIVDDFEKNNNMIDAIYSASQSSQIAEALSGVALLFSVGTLFICFRKKK